MIIHKVYNSFGKSKQIEVFKRLAPSQETFKRLLLTNFLTVKMGIAEIGNSFIIHIYHLFLSEYALIFLGFILMHITHYYYYLRVRKCESNSTWRPLWRPLKKLPAEETSPSAENWFW